MSSDITKYRAELDGLRAVAVISVLLYHVKFSLFGYEVFKGGFLGVDIFFVLSGYLITTIIFTQMNAGVFSLKVFLLDE
ncbi:acyltransferase family protein [Yersinia hibernica]|uniref:acyltransferase family protein n=1 Tax=Yersinia hibernica TaxID=2339259 RepID=UPI001FE45896|nr:acyltransferase family protein [Yersinia hibernica]